MLLMTKSSCPQKSNFLKRQQQASLLRELICWERSSRALVTTGRTHDSQQSRVSLLGCGLGWDSVEVGSWFAQQTSAPLGPPSLRLERTGAPRVDSGRNQMFAWAAAWLALVESPSRGRKSSLPQIPLLLLPPPHHLPSPVHCKWISRGASDPTFTSLTLPYSLRQSVCACNKTHSHTWKKAAAVVENLQVECIFLSVFAHRLRLT